jgi:2-oxopent-4-enoate/cis-2-oxohex-4-enoate hydratase
MADAAARAAWAEELYAALRGRYVVDPLTERDPSVSVEDAYHVSRALLERRLADGERVIGKKIGVTSEVVQRLLGVHEPDFGWLTDTMWVEREIPISTRLIQPRAEAEIALRLRADLQGPGVTPAQVLAATETVHTCFEVVDSRIRDWRVRIADTVADNASCGLFAVGPGVSPVGLDLAGCRCVVTKNGRFLSEGYGRAVQGSPLASIAWLANRLGAFGVPLRRGEFVLSGSLVPLEPVVPGDVMRASIDGIGDLEVVFT